MTIDAKTILDKVESGKLLTEDEQKAYMESEPAPEDYSKADVQDMTPEEFDAEEKKETNDNTEKEKQLSDEQKPNEKEKKSDDNSDDTVNKEDFVVRVERELEKPDGKENLKDFTDREKAYFHQMRRDRKRAQKAEAELDVERRKNLQKKEEEKKNEQPDPIEELRKREKTDYLTVEEALALAEQIRESSSKVNAEKPNDAGGLSAQQARYLELSEEKARADNQDYDVVLELADDILSNNTEYLKEIAQAMGTGENPALKAYELIKADPEFEKLLPLAQIKFEAKTGNKTGENKNSDPKSTENPSLEETPKETTPAETAKDKELKAAEAALKNNAQKTRTTGHIHDASDTQLEGMSLDEVGKMTDIEFAKLPRKTRQKYLEMMRDI